MKKAILLILVITLAFTLRFFKIGDYPATLYGDEQAFAWNAYNILLTGQDEYGTPYPLQFRSFNDYKSPIPVYLLVPFLKVFGLNNFSIRLPIVIFSSLSILITYLLAKEFTHNKIALISAFLMAISSWHVHLSRGYFEATLSLFFFITGVYFNRRSKQRIGLFLVGMLFFALSIYSYFTPRMLLLVFIPFLFIYDLKYQSLNNSVNMKNVKNKIIRNYIFGLTFLFIVSFPLLKATLYGGGFSRFDNLSGSMNKIITETVVKERNASLLPDIWRKLFHNKVTVWIRQVKNNYLEHLSINFWYLYGDNSLRYFTGNMGMFYLSELLFFIPGLYFLYRENRKVAVFFLFWIFLAPIPASIVGRPFAVRSIAMLPAPFMFVAYGIYKTISIKKSQYTHMIFPLVITLFSVFSLGSVLIRYYKEYPVYAATWWGWENKAAIDYAKESQESYDNIFISDYYTGAPLAFAVYSRYDPVEFRKALNNPVVMADSRHLVKLGKYYFGSLDVDKKRLEEGIIPPKSLYIGRPEETDTGETINAPDDNRIIFHIYKTN